MNPEQRDLLKEVFEAARHLEPGRRAEYLAGVCAGDEEVRREAESLLASLDSASGFIDSPAVLPPPSPATDPLLGQTLGQWRLLGEIARGGMGVVYRAVRDDESFRKEAAVKVLPAGVWAAHAHERFRSERKILARLDHPYIARLLDGGQAPDGRPYYVMDLVEGEWIDRYCDGRGLGVRERLELVAVVCDAVHYAHQNLVIHRDLKPGNILVTADGTPRLLDFGIAKLLDPTEDSGAEVTATELRALTPRYASPEQVTGGVLTTASDVYSLGVLLYELLTGAPPYEIRTGSPEELLRVVCQQEPERPSTVMRRGAARTHPATPGTGAASRTTTPGPDATPGLPARGPWRPILPAEVEGDLDWIVLKALRKEKERRYASARELVEDLRRHLAGLPVLARPDTVGYRVGKFVRRHRAATLLALLAVSAIAGGLGVSLWQWRRADAAHAEAERRFDDVRRLAGGLLFEVHDAVEKLPGSTPVRALIVNRGVEYLDRLAASSPEPELQAELAGGYIRLGDVQGRGGDASLGDAKAAIASYRKAVRLAEGLVVPGRATVELRELLARACARLAEALREAGEAQEADALLARSVALLEAAVAERPDHFRLRSSLAARRYNQGSALAASGEWERALEAYGRAAELYEALAQAEPAKPLHRRNAALARRYIGGVLTRLGRHDESRRQYETAAAIDRALLEASPQDPSAHLDLSYDLAELARLDERAGRLEQAAAGRREVLALRRFVLDYDPVNIQARAAVARGRADLSGTLRRLGRWTEAEAEMRRSVADWERLTAQTRGSPDPTLELAKALAYLGELLVAPERPAAGGGDLEACVLYRRSEDLFGSVRDRLPPKDRGWLDGVPLRDRCRGRARGGGQAGSAPPTDPCGRLESRLAMEAPTVCRQTLVPDRSGRSCGTG